MTQKYSEIYQKSIEKREDFWKEVSMIQMQYQTGDGVKVSRLWVKEVSMIPVQYQTGDISQNTQEPAKKKRLKETSSRIFPTAILDKKEDKC